MITSFKHQNIEKDLIECSLFILNGIATLIEQSAIAV